MIFTHERIRALREDKDFSQKEKALFRSVAQTTYSDYELGKINIPIDALKKLADFHDTSVDYMLDRIDVAAAFPKRREK